MAQVELLLMRENRQGGCKGSCVLGIAAQSLTPAVTTAHLVSLVENVTIARRWVPLMANNHLSHLNPKGVIDKI